MALVDNNVLLLIQYETKEIRSNFIMFLGIPQSKHWGQIVSIWLACQYSANCVPHNYPKPNDKPRDGPKVQKKVPHWQRLHI
jgi:hypothetical protein